MEYNLLSSLRKYRPRENQDPLENFVTEAFAWLLKNNEAFSNYFLRKVLIHLPAYAGIDLNKNFNCKWGTQINFGGIFPDMVARLPDGTVLIFEHKVWAQLHSGQLDSYKQFSSANYSNSYLILITANESQHLQEPDLAFCWRDVYIWIQEWIQSEKEKPEFIFWDFLNLLREEGLGPVAPISHEGILSYYSTRGFRDQVVNLVHQAAKRDWSYINPKLTVSGFKKSNGKVYYELNGRVALLILDEGYPSLTTGFILDWEHYRVPPILGLRSPDFSVMLRFTDKVQDKYSDLQTYLSLVSSLKSKIELLDDGWFFYDHLSDSPQDEKNMGFPIHIRKPMLDLLRGTTDSENQVNQFMKANELILAKIMECSEFWELRNFFSETDLNQ